MNRFQLYGTLGSDGELRGKVLTLRLVTEERVKKGDAWEKVATWHRVKVLGRSAEWRAAEALKGRRVFVEGRIEYGSYEKDGVKHYTTDLVAFDVEFTQRIPREGSQTPPTKEGEDEWGSPGDKVPF